MAHSTAAHLWAWHTAPHAFERLVPPWHQVEVTRFQDTFAAGESADLRVRVGPATFSWTARLTEVTPGSGFVDTAEGGPFASWTHHHRFEATEVGAALEDEVHWALPTGAVAHAVAGTWSEREVARLLAWRHRRTDEDLAAHARWRKRPRLKVGITGASGMVGTALSQFLTTGGHTVVPFVRRRPMAGEIGWDPASAQLDPSDLAGLDAVVHLAGEPVAGGTWNDARKARIENSRVDGTSLIARAVAAQDTPPVLLSASAVGYYGDRREPVDEDAPPGRGFLADTAVAWEQAADAARRAGARVVHPRIGIVQSLAGGALATQLPLFQAGMGGPVGGGNQPLPWIHLDDLVQILHLALWDDRLEGPVNCVAPQRTTQAAWARALGRALGRPAVIPTPAAAIRWTLGEMGEAMVLDGAPVRSARLADVGYGWLRPDLDEALQWEVGRFDPHAG